MATAVLQKSTTRAIDWASPDVDYNPTVEEYSAMVRVAESSPKMSFEQYSHRMNEWLTNNI